MKLQGITVLLGIGLLLLIVSGRTALTGEGTGSSETDTELFASANHLGAAYLDAVSRKENSETHRMQAIAASTKAFEETETAKELSQPQSQQIEVPPDIFDKTLDSGSPRIEATIINPFRSAAVATDVSGIIEEYNFDIGDLVQQGSTVLEVSRKRYDLVAQKAKENVRGLELALKRAQQDKAIKEKLVSLDASTQQDLLKAETEVDIIEHKLREGQLALKQALLDLEACQVKAPFTGYIALRYKEPFESAAALEKLFSLIDNKKVYAVAYVPENLMQFFTKGSKAAFNDSYGRQFVGSVEKIEPVIDPKTASQKVFVLVDNAEERLGIGMTGSLESIR